MWDGVNRRRFARAQYPCLVKVRKSTAPAQAVLTHTEDISVGGIRVIIAKKIEAMTEVDLEIDLQDTLPNVITQGTVNWVQEASAARAGRPYRYDTGIRFDTLKDEDRRRIQEIIERLQERQ